MSGDNMNVGGIVALIKPVVAPWPSWETYANWNEPMSMKHSLRSGK